MPATRGVRVGKVPVELTTFVGRRSELAEAKRLLEGTRLVTLTGVGGAGKTRLALRVVTTVQRGFRDGGWFVDLTQLRESAQQAPDPDVLADLVRAELGLRQRGGGPPMRQLTDHLAGRQALLVLDNCEHLLDACATVVDAVLRACPTVRVLATSREPLAVSGEMLYPVPPLSIPVRDQPANPAELGRYEAVALFTARARAAVPDFAVTDHNAGAVAELCRRVDGLPLAIELAAAHVRTLTPQQIVDRLADRFALLSRGSRAAPARQQTLRACVQWSFELCTGPERLLWARVSVFDGGFELDAVEGICPDKAIPEADLLDLVTALVDKSIVVRDPGGEVARYRMLETIREFGHEQLRATGEDDALRHRHRDWYQRLGDRATGQWLSDRQGHWMARLAAELPNLRSAIAFSLAEPGRADTALHLLMSVPLSYWFEQGLYDEARYWWDNALAKTGTASAVRARALLFHGQMTIAHGDTETGVRLLDRGEDLARQLDARTELAYAAFVRGVLALYEGDPTRTVDALDRMDHLVSTLAEPRPQLAQELHLAGLNVRGMAAGLAGDHNRAGACYQQLLAITERIGELRHRTYALWGQVISAWHLDRPDEAEASSLACLRLIRESAWTDLPRAAQCVEVLAWTAAGRRQHARAATLLGAADHLWATIGTPITAFGHLNGHHQACERQARAGLGDDEFTTTFSRGRTMPYEDGIGYALDDHPPTATPPPAGRPGPLTRREGQVAELLAQGLSNKAIAEVLVVSPRTVESHVEHILDKLSFTNRTQVAAWHGSQNDVRGSS